MEKSLTVQPVCRSRTTNRIKGNKDQDIVVKSMERNVDKNKSNKPMELQNNHEFDHNMPTYCEPLSIKLLGILPFIEAARPFIIEKKKTPTTAGNNNGIDNKSENKEAMLRTYNLHNKTPHNKLRDNKNLPSSCALLSSNSLGNLPFFETPKPFPIRKKENIKTSNRIKMPADISEFTVLDSDETPKPFPIRKKENIKTNNCIKIPADISEFIVLDSDEHSSENANIESRFFLAERFRAGPVVTLRSESRMVKAFRSSRRQTTIYVQLFHCDVDPLINMYLTISLIFLTVFYELPSPSRINVGVQSTT